MECVQNDLRKALTWRNIKLDKALSCTEKRKLALRGRWTTPTKLFQIQGPVRLSKLLVNAGNLFLLSQPGATKHEDLGKKFSEEDVSSN